MTANEFKAWLDGYMENQSGRPTKAMLDRICEKAQELSDVQPGWYPNWTWNPVPWQPAPTITIPTWICETTASSVVNDVTSDYMVVTNEIGEA